MIRLRHNRQAKSKFYQARLPFQSPIVQPSSDILDQHQTADLTESSLYDIVHVGRQAVLLNRDFEDDLCVGINAVCVLLGKKWIMAVVAD